MSNLFKKRYPGGMSATVLLLLFGVIAVTLVAVGGRSGEEQLQAYSCSQTVQIYPPATGLASVVAEKPQGTCFRLNDGTYRFSRVVPKDNMVFIGTATAKVIVDGRGQENAFHGAARNVSISNMTLRNFDNLGGTKAQEQAPIRGVKEMWIRSHNNYASGWKIENIEAHGNVANAVFMGHNFTVKNSKIYNNGVAGIGGSHFQGGLVEGNEVFDNGDQSVLGEYQNGAVGMKFTQVKGLTGASPLVIRDNHIYSRYQNDTRRKPNIGIWCDVDCQGVVIEENLIENLRTAGIFYEISRNAIIRNNTIKNSNTWTNWRRMWNKGCIGIAESRDVVITGNTISNCVSAITLQQTNRGDRSSNPSIPSGKSGEPWLQGLIDAGTIPRPILARVEVYNNKISGSSSTGAAHDAEHANGLADYGSIAFKGNTYANQDSMQFWFNNTSKNFSGWQADRRDDAAAPTPRNVVPNYSRTSTPTPTPQPNPTPTPTPTPTPQPTPAGVSVIITARGTTGEERISLKIDDTIVKSWVVGTGFADYTYSAPQGTAADQLKVAYENDGRSSRGADKNVVVDKISVAGVIYQTEADTTYSVGSYAQGSCAAGYKKSEWLQCNGYFRYADAEEDEGDGDTQPTEPIPQPANGSKVTVTARGTTGTEVLKLLINDEQVSSWKLSTENKQYNFIHRDKLNVNQVKVLFDNNGTDAGGKDKDVFVLGTSIDERFYLSKSKTTYSTGTWSSNGGCSPGNKESEWLQCDGYFQYSGQGIVGRTVRPIPVIPPRPAPKPVPAPQKQSVVVVARGQTGEETMLLKQDDRTIRTWRVTATNRAYSLEIDQGVDIGRLKIAFEDDGRSSRGADKNLIVDYLKFNGKVYQTEDLPTYSVGAWSSGEGCAAGHKQSEKLNCNGYFRYGQPAPAPAPKQTSVTVRARGATGEETILLKVNNRVVKSWRLSRSNQDYSHTLSGLVGVGQIKIAYEDDGRSSSGKDKNVVVDYLMLNDRVFQTEDQDVYSVGSWNSSAKCGGGYKKNETLHCNGYFRYEE